MAADEVAMGAWHVVYEVVEERDVEKEDEAEEDVEDVEKDLVAAKGKEMVV